MRLWYSVVGNAYACFCKYYLHLVKSPFVTHTVCLHLYFIMFLVLHLLLATYFARIGSAYLLCACLPVSSSLTWSETE